VTRISETHIDDALYEEVRPEFVRKEIADLTLAVVAINGGIALQFRSAHLLALIQPRGSADHTRAKNLSS